MKTMFACVASLLLFPIAWAQNPALEVNAPAVNAHTTAAPAAETSPAAAVFDLNFPGGGPRALVAAIEEASGKRLNVIIPNEYEDVEIPPMRFTRVTVPALFEALRYSSQHTVQSSQNGMPNNFTSSYGFVSKKPDENAVWWFSCERLPKPQEVKKYCQFYQLDELLTNYSIEDITTAIQTGWKMLGVSPMPELKFHSETKLLIAVGQAEHLQTITSVLSALRRGPADVRTTMPKSAVATPKQ
jgi:hypothetical protein